MQPYGIGNPAAIIGAGWEKSQPRPMGNFTMMKNNLTTAPAMARDEYDELPEIVKRFLTWERAREPLTVKRVGPPAKAANPNGYKYFTEGKR